MLPICPRSDNTTMITRQDDQKTSMDVPTTSTSGANGICCHPEFSELFKMKSDRDLDTFIPNRIFSTRGSVYSQADKFQPCTKSQIEET